MIRFAPNLTFLFTELPERERVAAAKAQGFDAVEWIFPYALPKDEVAKILSDSGVTNVYGVLPADWDNENYGWAGRPGAQDDFRRAAETGIAYAMAGGFQTLQVGHGLIPDGRERAECIDTVVENLAWICAQTKGLPFPIVIEPVTTHRRGKPFVLSTMAQAADVMDRVGADNLALVYDTYHLRLEEPGALTAHFDLYKERIGYAQIGNVPGRHEPGTGEIDLDHIIAYIRDAGYDGVIGLEYDPSPGKDTWGSLAWLKRYGYRVARP
jgi:hydroxypyruvate isomerase